MSLTDRHYNKNHKKIQLQAQYICFLLIFLLSACLNFGWTTVSASTKQTDKAILTEQQLENVKKSINALHKELRKDKQSQEKEQKSLKKIELELADLRHKKRALNKEKEGIEKHLSTLNKEKRSLDKEKHQQQQALTKDLRALYKIGKQEKLKLLLNQESPENVARILKYYDYYTEARVDRIINFQAHLSKIEEKQTEIEIELSELKIVEDNIQEEQLALKKKQSKRQNILKDIEKNIKNKDQELNKLKANQLRLSKLLKSLKGIWADIPKHLAKKEFRTQKGKLKRPVAGKVKNRFGSQRVGGRLKWNGWLISAKLDDEVKVVHDGRVVFSDWIRGYGLLIIVDHGKGYLSLYGHNASLLNETGDWIQSGDVIATVGDSGGQSEVGLYFELRQDGKPLNPKSWLR